MGRLRETAARARRAAGRTRLALAAALTCALLAGAAGALPAPAAAAETDADATEAAFSAEEPPSLACPSALLVDLDTGTVLLEKDADSPRYPASTTKVMTALLVLENADLTSTVTVEEADFAELTADSSVAGLRAGETYTIRNLLACLLLPSGNDAAYVLARAVGGDWQTFVGMMNERAAELGCTGTHFANPCGLHADDHYTTARDLARIFAAALEHPEFAEIAGSATWELPATELSAARILTTTDALVNPESAGYLDVVTAGKTGYTGEAGRCLVASGEKDGMRLVAVALGGEAWTVDETGLTQNFSDVRALLEWGFGAWETGAVVAPGDELTQADVELSSDGDEVAAVATGEVVATVPRGTELSDLTVEPSWEGAFQAPLEQGESLGRARVLLGERELGSVGLAAATAMELSLVDFAFWWLSDPVHAVIAVAVFVGVCVVIGAVASVRSRRRRERWRVQAQVPRAGAGGLGSGVGRVTAEPYRGERLRGPDELGARHAGGRHAAPKHGRR